MSKTIGIIDEPVQPGSQDNLDINIHSQALIEFIENSNTPIKFEMCDLLNHRSLYDLLKQTKPDAIIHFAEQPSAPYSMKGREACFFTQNNNVRKLKK